MASLRQSKASAESDVDPSGVLLASFDWYFSGNCFSSSTYWIVLSSRGKSIASGQSQLASRDLGSIGISLSSFFYDKGKKFINIYFLFLADQFAYSLWKNHLGKLQPNGSVIV